MAILPLLQQQQQGIKASRADNDHASVFVHLPRLSLDWGHLKLSSPLANAMLAHQANCSAPLTEFRFRNRFGLGSDLHLWPIALCNAMEQGHRLVTLSHQWIYWDQVACGDRDNRFALPCYFGQVELQCPSDAAQVVDGVATSNQPTLPKIYQGKGSITPRCVNVLARYGVELDAIVDAGMEVLFSHVTPTVVEEARRQLRQVFGPHGIPLLSHLITVHIRWGDKHDEMNLVPMEAYVQAVRALEEAHQNDMNNTFAPTHIYLASEDPSAIQEFLGLAPRHWKIHVEAYYEQFAPHRVEGYNGNPRMTAALQGRPGLVALASALVALEASSFVLTTSSNWSRLLDELRRVVVQAQRGPTRLVDLRPLLDNQNHNNKRNDIRTEGISDEAVALIRKLL